MEAGLDRPASTLNAGVTGVDERQLDLDPLYIAARRVLLDALAALAAHGQAVIVAGAQAIYLRTGSADLAVAPYTVDGDVALDPNLLSTEPTLASAMMEAGFRLKLRDGHEEPGTWARSARVGARDVSIPVDLIVPEGAAQPIGRRGARLGVHGNRAAKRAVGLEAALVDHSPLTIQALDPEDDRSTRAEVAGVAALLVAKAHKLHDRGQGGRSHRLVAKDAADVVRLMQATLPAAVGSTLMSLVDHPVAGKPSKDALTYIDELFGRPGRLGIELATTALAGVIAPDRVGAICTAYVAVLLARV